ncbi:uncharacterized protein DUF4189 [Stella humosa]|uniref:Uncharacterized protein DUF4189 n=1 Tax=Stella humosa TaxID=94 RepID=A0A3N1MF47_9PROT|nr:DUF4189 domain-containing protein [Stella humosa]ROQ01337.1 uncharacterized protein DUF4189 [Stella humosa]BBK31711.1 hypothetical protein STHU_23450 [Stella humosa]
MAAIRSALLAVVLPLLASAALAQDCEIRCRTGCYGNSTADAWKCDEDRRSCIASCRSEQGSGSSGSSAPATRSFGAIAYSRAAGTHGYSYGRPSRAAAEATALGHCRRAGGRTGDCAVLTWFWNSCGALSVAGNGSYGADHGPDRAAAERGAARVCARFGGTDCRTVAWTCSR